MAKKRIYIDPGHSKNDPGAVKYAVERDLNEKVAKFMNECLQATFVCETKVDPITTGSVSQVAANANKWKANLLVSIHFNAGGGDGYEALVYGSKRKKLGQIFEKHVKAAGQNSRGVKYRPGLGVLRLSNMPAILNEGAFVDNKKDIQDWNEDHELKKLGIAYAKAAAEYLKLPKKVVEPAPEEPEDTIPDKAYTYRVQVGAYTEEASAAAMQKKLKAAGYPAIIVKEEK
jgi:N-acetylmuramoyl-L-alanine amidase